MLSLKQRQELFVHCTQSTHSDFYKNLYAAQDFLPANIASEDVWQRIPILTKEDLIAASLAERSFLPLSELDHIRASSGTSGKGPLFSPRTTVKGMEYRHEYHDFSEPFMAFGIPMMAHWHEQIADSLTDTPQVISYDPTQPALSVRMANAVGVTGMSLFVFHLKDVCEAYKNLGGGENIKLVEMAGEVCSHALLSLVHDTFPNAQILQSYGASEVEDVHIGMPCCPTTPGNPDAVYYSKETHYLELVDADGVTIEPKIGAEGSLLITAYPGEPSAFPLIRFAIGDTVRVVNCICKTHDGFTFTVLGRTELDFLKIEGGVLRADEMARTLRSIDTVVSDEFELHRFQRTVAGKVLTQLEVHVCADGDIDYDKLATEIASVFRVSPNRTYADMVDADTALPLTCLPLNTKTTKQKAKRIISHA